MKISCFKVAFLSSLLLTTSVYAMEADKAEQGNQSISARLLEKSAEIPEDKNPFVCNELPLEIQTLIFKQKSISLDAFPQVKKFEKIITPLLSSAFQYAGQMAAQKVVRSLEDQISKHLLPHRVPYAAKDLMYSKIHPSVAAKIGAQIVRGLVWGGYYGYKAISLVTNQDYWEFVTDTLHPQFAEQNHQQ